MVYERIDEIPERKNLIKKLTEWIRPLAIGKFGLGMMIGNKELFIGVMLSQVVMETIIKQRKLKSYKRTGDLRVVDL